MGTRRCHLVTKCRTGHSCLVSRSFSIPLDDYADGLLGGGPYLYGVNIDPPTGNTTLSKFDLSTKAWSVVGNLGTTVTASTSDKRYNALYSGSGSGDLFGLEGYSGELWKFNVNTLSAQKVTQGPVGSSEADGARCLNATI